ncbi:MAG: 4Fe-4S dicluster domain-containing protein [Deltaproteobacteria bacterium]|nr:4Fe-4S dicluster domain-containing protein [Deltaproteobacteria bacterium]
MQEINFLAPEMPPSALTLAERLQKANVPVTVCYQCKKCSAGCPLTFAMDLLPDQVIRLALLGQEERLLPAVTPWVCSSCETCTTRCPNGIDIAGVMDWLKEEALKRGIAVPEPLIADFYRLFLDSVRQGGGRLGEFRLVRRFGLLKLKRRGSFGEMKADLKLGWQLFKRGRLRLLGPPKLKGNQEIKKIFQQSGLK